MAMPIPNDVVEALKGIVHWLHSYKPNDNRFIGNDLPTVLEWFEKQGVSLPRPSPPLDTEAS
jgi:hypothetical protein